MDLDAVAAWDAEADDFDVPADHGLSDPRVRAAWRALLVDLLPDPPGRLADLGCGTGTLSALLADEGWIVDGIDFAPRMVELARTKTAGRPGVTISRGDAADPALAATSYDVVLVRHVLWAMPDPSAALERWFGLLRPGGMLVLVEGFWSNEAGLRGAETVALVEGVGGRAELTPLTDPDLWGRETGDERYVVVGSRQVDSS